MKTSNLLTLLRSKWTSMSATKRWLTIASFLVGLPAIGQLANMALLNQVFEQAGSYANFYGDGKDGALTIPTGVWAAVPVTYQGYPTRPLSVNTIRSYLTANATAGTNTLTIATSYTSPSFDSGSDSGFASGGGACSTTTNCQEVLIMQMGGTNAGLYEFALLQTRSGGTLTLYTNLKNSYTSADKVQVMVVPRYTNITFNSGAHLTVGQWDNNTGGVIAFRSNGTITMSTSDSGAGRYIAKIVAGYYQDNPGSAGYGFGVTGANARDAFDLTASNSTYDGKSVSPGTHERLIMGGGGNSYTGTGGKGGGIILAKVNSIAMDAKLIVTGQDGVLAGQGGASGSIYVAGSAFSSCNPTALNAPATGGGSAGEAGRIFLHYTSSLAAACGTTGSPTANTTVRKAYLK